MEIETEIPDKIVFDNPNLVVDWGVDKKWTTPCCGKERQGLDFKVLIWGPDDLDPSEKQLMQAKWDSLCTDCWSKWKEEFYAKRKIARANQEVCGKIQDENRDLCAPGC